MALSYNLADAESFYAKDSALRPQLRLVTETFPVATRPGQVPAFDAEDGDPRLGALICLGFTALFWGGALLAAL